MPSRKAVTKRKTGYVYQVEASYPTSQYPNNSKEALMGRLARACGGKHEGSGMGFGYRDLGFLFKSRAEASCFIAKLKANRIRRSGVHDWSKY